MYLLAILTLNASYVDSREYYSAEPTAVGILRVMIDPHLGDGRIPDLTCRGIVPLGGLGGGVGVEEALLAVAEDAFLVNTKLEEYIFNSIVVWVRDSYR